MIAGEGVGEPFEARFVGAAGAEVIVGELLDKGDVGVVVAGNFLEIVGVGADTRYAFASAALYDRGDDVGVMLFYHGEVEVAPCALAEPLHRTQLQYVDLQAVEHRPQLCEGEGVDGVHHVVDTDLQPGIVRFDSLEGPDEGEELVERGAGHKSLIRLAVETVYRQCDLIESRLGKLPQAVFGEKLAVGGDGDIGYAGFAGEPYDVGQILVEGRLGGTAYLQLDGMRHKLAGYICELFVGHAAPEGLLGLVGVGEITHAAAQVARQHRVKEKPDITAPQHMEAQDTE